MSSNEYRGGWERIFAKTHDAECDLDADCTCGAGTDEEALRQTEDMLAVNTRHKLANYERIIDRLFDLRSTLHQSTEEIELRRDYNLLKMLP